MKQVIVHKHYNRVGNVRIKPGTYALDDSDLHGLAHWLVENSFAEFDTPLTNGSEYTEVIGFALSTDQLDNDGDEVVIEKVGSLTGEASRTNVSSPELVVTDDRGNTTVTTLADGRTYADMSLDDLRAILADNGYSESDVVSDKDAHWTIRHKEIVAWCEENL